MKRSPRIPRLAAGCAALLLVCGSDYAQRIALRPARGAADDLEVTGLTPSPGYLSRAALKKLPQVETVIEHDPEFPGLRMHVSGVSLETLSKALRVPAGDDLMDMLCTDNYRSHYPADHVQRHHPMLVLLVDGKTPAAWAAATKNEDPGPYFVAYDHYVPAFQVMAHSDQRQIPSNAFRLHVTSQEATYGPISPPGPATREVDAGFTIAKQNCLRCHSQGEVGGTKSKVTWPMLGAMAKNKPEDFARYIHSPAEIDEHATMPGNPGYDNQTLAALTAYFHAMTGAAQ